jgi:phosphatidate cytidylyltransferase
MLVAAAAAAAALELHSALAHGGYQPRVALGVLFTLTLALAPALEPLVGHDPTLPALALIVIVSLVIDLRCHATLGMLVGWSLTLAGAAYIGALLGHILLLRQIEAPLHPSPLATLGLAPGAAWVLFTMTATWGQDAAAYFAGKWGGRTPMTPGLSPKKTWEGAAGGLLGAIVIGALAVPLFGLPIPIVAGALLGAVAGILGPLGDLSESLIKRQVGLKDTGSLIPGHGGILDRVDSLLFTAPAIYYLALALL